MKTILGRGLVGVMVTASVIADPHLLAALSQVGEEVNGAVWRHPAHRVWRLPPAASGLQGQRKGQLLLPGQTNRDLL